MKKITDKIEWFMDLGGIKKDVTFLVISGIAMGGVGSDIAVDATDISLVNDYINFLAIILALPAYSIRLSVHLYITVVPCSS